MAALSTFTGTSATAEVRYPEHIERVLPYGYANIVAVEALAWILECPRGFGGVKAIPKYTATTIPAGNVTESDVLTDGEMDFSEQTITVGTVGGRFPFSFEGDYEANSGGMSDSMVEIRRAMLSRMESDALSSITSVGAGNSVSDDTTALTESVFLTGLQDFVEQEPGEGPVAFVHTPASIFNLYNDLSASTATRANLHNLGPNASGYWGTVHGVEIFSSSNCPADGNGYSGCFVQMGDKRSGLGLAVEWGVTLDLVPSEDRLVTFCKAHARYGVGLTGQPITEVIASA